MLNGTCCDVALSWSTQNADLKLSLLCSDITPPTPCVIVLSLSDLCKAWLDNLKVELIAQLQYQCYIWCYHVISRCWWNKVKTWTLFFLSQNHSGMNYSFFSVNDHSDVKIIAHPYPKHQTLYHSPLKRNHSKLAFSKQLIICNKLCSSPPFLYIHFTHGQLFLFDFVVVFHL